MTETTRYRVQWTCAVQEFYDLTMVDENGEPAGWMTALQTAVTSIVLLWSMRAGRNITSIPFAVSTDTDSDGWFSAPTLYQSSVGRKSRKRLAAESLRIAH